MSCRRSAEDVGAEVVPGAEAGGGAGLSGVLSLTPQSEQNLAPGRFSPPHDGHRAGIDAPHSSQNLLRSRTSARQLGHSMSHLNRQRRSAYHRMAWCCSGLVWPPSKITHKKRKCLWDRSRRGWRPMKADAAKPIPIRSGLGRGRLMHGSDTLGHDARKDFGSRTKSGLFSSLSYHNRRAWDVLGSIDCVWCSTRSCISYGQAAP